MRRFIVYLATSADGFIARPDGAYDFLDRPWPKHQYGMPAFLKSVDAIVMGRKSYDIGGAKGWGKKKVYVLSHEARKAKDAVFFSDAAALARTLRAAKGNNIWLFGGSESIAAFLDAGEVDEIRTFVVPVLIGEGIPLLTPRHRNVPLSLIEAKPFEDGVVMLHYSVTR
jgi:dihydrofolate reductase